jgi:hypothetical protein
MKLRETFQTERFGIPLTLALLFALSVGIRHPLFNHEFTLSHEWLSAHTLITVELWNQVPAEVHHFDLLYTFPGSTNRFVNDLWTAGVADPLGNYYYVSMPPLGFLTPYVFFKVFHQRPGIAALQACGLTLHFIVCALLYLLVRLLTSGRRGSPAASGAALCVFLFAPTALYYYQNAIVGSVVVIPYTVAVLIAATILSQGDASRRVRRFAWPLLFIALVGGCLADWQGFFTAFAAAVVSLAAAIRFPHRRRTAVGVLLLACLGVAIAIAIIIFQYSRIQGFSPFVHTILGRLRERTSGNNVSLWSFDYYRRLSRFYVAYLPFVICAAAFLWLAIRRGYRGVPQLFRRAAAPLAISILAVITDHVVLANHTAIHIFTTLNTLVPIAILTGLAVLAYLESTANLRRDAVVAASAILICMAVSTGEYYFAYRGRPHPFRKSASEILASAKPDDVIFATGNGFSLGTDIVVPQLIYYLNHNVEVVDSAAAASQYLGTHGFSRGVLAHLNQDYTVSEVEAVNSAGTAGGTRK